MNRNYWLDGMMGVIVGDALGCPVQFMSREEIATRPEGAVKGMESGGVYNTQEGTWTDDSSMSLATLDSIRELGVVDTEDIMTAFVDWYEDGEYTPFGEAFDIGNTCSSAIEKYENTGDLKTCGGTSEYSNGNGSLMRIMPVCLYAAMKGLTDEEAISLVHEVSGLTHNHLRSKIACGLYYFCVKEILGKKLPIGTTLKRAMEKGFEFYDKDIANKIELAHLGRLRDVRELGATDIRNIESSGYVVHSLEAAIWSVMRGKDFTDALLIAVNLGDDTDTIGAIAGGLAGLYYGYGSIPKEWLAVIKRREWIEEMCRLVSE